MVSSDGCVVAQGFPTPGGEPIRARIGSHDLTVDLGQTASLRLDAEGRWCSMRLGAARWRRLLSGEAVAIVGGVGRALGWPDSAAVHEQARDLAGELRRNAEQAGSVPEAMGRIAAWLQRAAAWSPERFVVQGALYRAAYGDPVAMLPPDRYGDLVVQPATGCPHATCSFCVLYRNQSFRLLSDHEFQRHLLAVCDLHGEALARRRGAFLGSANALAAPTPLLVRRLHEVAAVAADLPRGFAAFWDPDHSPERSDSDWRELVAAGLRMVCAGLESGLPSLRRRLGKAPDVSRFVDRLRAAHDCGVAVAVTVLIGLPFADEAAHLAATAEVLGSLRLSTADLVYVSPLWSESGEPQQDVSLGPSVAAFRQTTAARVAPYRIERFRHYA